MTEVLGSLGGALLDGTAMLYLVSLVLRLAARGRPRVGVIAKALFLVALLVHTVGLLIRWAEGGLVEIASVEAGTGQALQGLEWLGQFLSHPPFTNLYETLVFFAWGIGVTVAVSERKREPGLTGVFAVVLLWIALGLASLSVDREVEPLVPALRSWWLHAHVAFAAFAYAAFALAAVTSVLYLVRDGVKPAWFGLIAAAGGLFTALALAGGGLFSGEYGVSALGADGQGGVERLLVAVHTRSAMMGVGGGSAVELRFGVPVAGWLLLGAAIVCFVAIVLFGSILRRGVERSRAGALALLCGVLLLAGAGGVAVGYSLSSPELELTADQATQMGIDRAVERMGLPGPEAIAQARVLAAPPYRLSPRAYPYDLALLVLAVACGLFALAVHSPRIRMVERLPEVRALDRHSHRATLVGFPLMTLVIATGAIWAYYAWGRYWGWDPKETWSLITWFVYALYLHARFTRGWAGRRAALISVIGFLSVIFTFLGVNLLLSGLHSYATG